MYIVGFITFIPALYGNASAIPMENGKYLIWYLLLSSWGTDIFAYLVGKHFGKHKFSKVSPNKTIEGCVAGTIGAIITCVIYTFLLQKVGGVETYSYGLIALIAFVLSVVGQIGDFAASAIKRYFDVKDFSEVFPGHGGMLDRIDSFMFSAPYAYFIFIILLA
jgi:phosphatidate cytidylyltransferase